MKGNQQKMREALVKIHDLTNALDEEYGVDPVEIRDIARAALAEPARNCDVGTAKEQYLRMVEYCDKQNGREPCEKCQFFTCGINCALAWGQMPYEAKEEEGDEQHT